MTRLLCRFGFHYGIPANPLFYSFFGLVCARCNKVLEVNYDPSSVKLAREVHNGIRRIFANHNMLHHTISAGSQVSEDLKRDAEKIERLTNILRSYSEGTRH